MKSCGDGLKLTLLLARSRWCVAMREKCPYSDFFWSVFCHIWTEYRPAKIRIRTLFMQCRVWDDVATKKELCEKISNVKICVQKHTQKCSRDKKERWWHLPSIDCNRQGLDALDEWHSSSERVRDSKIGNQGCSELMVASKTYHNSILNVSWFTFRDSFVKLHLR